MFDIQSQCHPTQGARQAAKWPCNLVGAQRAGLGSRDKVLSERLRGRLLKRPAQAFREEEAWLRGQGRKEGSAQHRLLLRPPFQAGSGFSCHSSKGLTQARRKAGPVARVLLRERGVWLMEPFATTSEPHSCVEDAQLFI